MAVILIVEDDFFIRELCELTIKGWGHRTLVASDVDEALFLLGSDEEVDILFTDIYLKKRVLGGCELAQEAVVLRPNLRVLYTTGNFISNAMRSLFLGDSVCLAKPYTPEQLEHSLGDLLVA